MGIFEEFVDVITKICEIITIPYIKKIFIPKNRNFINKNTKNKFGVVILEDLSIGIIYLNLLEVITKNKINLIYNKYLKRDPCVVLKEIDSKDNFTKTIGFGIINAISQFVFKKSNYQFNFTNDVFGLINLKSKDHIGMVGFFPPLVKKIDEMGFNLTIIEKKKELVKKTDKWEVSLNPAKLEICNKILCTSTTVLNDSIDDILKYSSNAKKIAIIGPTAGFVPDPLFKRKIDIVGGTYISNPSLFLKLITQNKKWSPATKKYCIIKDSYIGIDGILKKI